MGRLPRLLLISGLTWYVIFEGSRAVFLVLNMSELHVVDVHTFAVYRIQSKTFEARPTTPSTAVGMTDITCFSIGLTR